MLDTTLSTSSAEETQRVARIVGEACLGGEAFLLVGQLGAGKTCFTQGLARGLGVREYTHSPTFVLVTEYHGRLPLYHVDLYRIESDLEAVELGLDEYMNSGGVIAIEWADRAAEALAGRGLLVEIGYEAGDQRTIRFHPRDALHEALLSRVQARLERAQGPV